MPGNKKDKHVPCGIFQYSRGKQYKLHTNQFTDSEFGVASICIIPIQKTAKEVGSFLFLWILAFIDHLLHVPLLLID